MASSYGFVVPPRPPSPQSQQRSWDQVKAQVTALYESHGLDQVIHVMEKTHGFSRTKKQYKTQIARWGLDKKHIKTVEYKAMLKKKRRLKQSQDGGALTFFLHGQEVPDSKISRFEQRMIRAGKISESDTFSEIATPPDLCCNWQAPLPHEIPSLELDSATPVSEQIPMEVSSVETPIPVPPPALFSTTDHTLLVGNSLGAQGRQRNEAELNQLPYSRYFVGTAYDLRSHTASNLFGAFGGRSHIPDGSNTYQVSPAEDPPAATVNTDTQRDIMPQPPYDLWSVFLLEDIPFTVDVPDYKQSAELRAWFKGLLTLLGEDADWYQSAPIYSQVASACWNCISGCLMSRDPKYQSDPTYLVNFHVTNLKQHLYAHLQSPKITRKHISNLFVQTLVKLHLMFLPKGPDLNLTQHVSNVIRVELKNGTAGQNHEIFDSLVAMRETFIIGRCLLEVLIFVGELLFCGGLHSNNEVTPVDQSVLALYECFKRLLPTFKSLPIPVRFNYGGFEFWDNEQGWVKIGLS